MASSQLIDFPKHLYPFYQIDSSEVKYRINGPAIPAAQDFIAVNEPNLTSILPRGQRPLQ